MPTPNKNSEFCVCFFLYSLRIHFDDRALEYRKPNELTWIIHELLFFFCAHVMHSNGAFLLARWCFSAKIHWWSFDVVGSTIMDTRSLKAIKPLIINDKILQTTYPHPLIQKPFNHIYLTFFVFAHRAFIFRIAWYMMMEYKAHKTV